MNRRAFLKAAGLAGAAAATGSGLLTLLRPGKRSFENLEQEVKYIQEHIANVTSFQKHGPETVIVLPDIHATSIHKHHYDAINKLHDQYGLALVCVEGDWEPVTPKSLDNEVDIYLKNPDWTCQLARNEEMIFGKPAKKIRTKEDLLDVMPLMRFAYPESGIALVGVDNKQAHFRMAELERLKKAYEHFADAEISRRRMASKMNASKEYIESLQKRLEESKNESYAPTGNPTVDKLRDYLRATRKEDEEELKERLASHAENSAELRKHTDTAVKGFKQLTAIMEKTDVSGFPDVEEGLNDAISSMFTPFYNAVEKEYRGIVLDQRSIDAVVLTQKAMQERRLASAALVYGAEHVPQITDELAKRGLSYAVIKHHRD